MYIGTILQKKKFRSHSHCHKQCRWKISNAFAPSICWSVFTRCQPWYTALSMRYLLSPHEVHRRLMPLSSLFYGGIPLPGKHLWPTQITQQGRTRVIIQIQDLTFLTPTLKMWKRNRNVCVKLWRTGVRPVAVIQDSSSENISLSIQPSSFL